MLLPDTTSSARYESFDRPYLTQAFEAAGLTTDDFKIDNAQGSAQHHADPGRSRHHRRRQRAAHRRRSTRAAARPSRPTPTSKGVKVIDYDRLVKGGADGRIYVSFDNVKVGKLIGQGESTASPRGTSPSRNVLVMDGDPTDNNAKLFAQGYNGVLKPQVRRRRPT